MPVYGQLANPSITAGMRPNITTEVCLVTDGYLVTEAFSFFGKGFFSNNAGEVTVHVRM